MKNFFLLYLISARVTCFLSFVGQPALRSSLEFYLCQLTSSFPFNTKRTLKFRVLLRRRKFYRLQFLFYLQVSTFFSTQLPALARPYRPWTKITAPSDPFSCSSSGLFQCFTYTDMQIISVLLVPCIHTVGTVYREKECFPVAFVEGRLLFLPKGLCL